MNSFLKIDIKLERNNFQMHMKVDIPKGITGIYGTIRAWENKFV